MTERHRRLTMVIEGLFGKAMIAGVAVIVVMLGTSVYVAHNKNIFDSIQLANSTSCQFQKADQPLHVAFCDSFSQAMATGNRSGDLNGTVWGVSRVTGAQNQGSPTNAWLPTQLNLCGQQVNVSPDKDVRICNGHVAEATTDGGAVTTLAMYPKQPFDIASRTGTVTFDVSDDSQGSHAAWPEFWYTDKPVPAPFTHEDSWRSFPANGFGVRFARRCDSGQGFNCGDNCPGNNADPVVSVDSAVIIRNYVGDDSFTNGNIDVKGDSCMVEPTKAGQMNHIELRISQSQIDVYGTDAFTPGTSVPPLKHLATIPNANLTLTRGLIWLEDVHYNGNKFNSQGTHTFNWDNVGFDGPVLPRDLAYDAIDNSAPDDGAIDLGWYLPASGSQTVNVTNVTAASITGASAGLLTFNFWSEQDPSSFQFAINGHSHTYTWPYPYRISFSPMTIAIPFPLSDMQPGTNTVTFRTDGSTAMNVFNVDLIMVGAGGFPSCFDPSDCVATPLSGSYTSSTGSGSSTGSSSGGSTTGSGSGSTSGSGSGSNSGSSGGGTPTPTPVPSGTKVGLTTIGTVPDTGDMNCLNGSRIKTTNATSVKALTVYMPDVDSAPMNQFSVGVYSDRKGQPDQLVAQSHVGVLVPNAWNTLNLSANLAANTTYWLMYYTNGDNNMPYNDVNSELGAWACPGGFGAFPATLSNVTVGDWQYSIYATLN